MKTIMPFITEYFNLLFKIPLCYFAFRGVVSITGLSLWLAFVLYVLIVICFVLSDKVFDVRKDK